MAGPVRAEYESIEIVGRSLRDTADELRSLLMRIYYHLSVLQSGGWLGEAADRFYDEMDSFFIPWLKQLETQYDDTGERTLNLIPLLQNMDDHVSQYFGGAGGKVSFSMTDDGASSAFKFFRPNPAGAIDPSFKFSDPSFKFSPSEGTFKFRGGDGASGDPHG